MTNLRLEALDHDWLEDVAALVEDPEVLRFTRVPEPPPAGYARAWIDRYVTGRAAGRCEGFAALDDADRFLGLGLAPTIDRTGGEVELGYIVAAPARGRGVATELLRRLTAWAFDELAAVRAYLIIDTANPASLRVAERCGYQFEGVMRSIHIKQDRRTDAALWSRLRTDP